jgi:hypothetical protein
MPASKEDETGSRLFRYIFGNRKYTKRFFRSQLVMLDKWATEGQKLLKASEPIPNPPSREIVLAIAQYAQARVDDEKQVYQILQVLALMTIENREQTASLIEALTKTDAQRDKDIRLLQRRSIDNTNDVKEFTKYEDVLSLISKNMRSRGFRV